MDDDDACRDLTARLLHAATVLPRYRGGGGRGILIPAGGDYLVGAFAIVGVLRWLGCHLPIEIWHQGPGELTDVADAIRRRFPGVTFHDIGRDGGKRWDGGWQLKAEALAATTLDEVLLLDADNLPLVDPAALFEIVEYRETGALFWPAPTEILEPSRDCWARFGLQPREAIALDSGQMLVNRRSCCRALAAAEFANRHSGYFWAGLHGDKDTFLLAWLVADLSYGLVMPRPFLIDDKALVQGGIERCQFQHRYGAKWKRGRNLRLTVLPAEGVAHRLIDELAIEVTR